MGEDPDVIRGQLERTRAQLTETIDALGYKADVPARAKDRVSGTFDRAREAIGGTVEHARETAPDTGQMADNARRAAGVAQENPLGLAAGAIAAGFLIGMVLPGSRVEDERVGAIADTVKSHAAELGQEALEHGKEVVSQAAETTVETTRQAVAQEASELRETAAGHAEAVKQEARADVGSR